MESSVLKAKPSVLFTTEKYVQSGTSYDEYAPAYQYGWESQSQYKGKSFDESESKLRQEWDKARGASKLEWDRAREAVRDSWNRMANRRDSGSNP